MILNNQIDIVLNGSNISKYKEKYGNDIKVNTKITVDISDIPDYSSVIIDCKCEICGVESRISRANYTTNIKNGGYYGCRKCSRLKSKKTCFSIYGVENAFQSEEVKNKIKSKNLEKYGVENTFQSEEIKNKIKSKNLEKYGGGVYSQTDDFINKFIRTNLERYGVKYPMQLDINKEKSINTTLKKYGVPYYSQTDECKERIITTNLKKYGVSNYAKLDECKDKMRNTNLERYGFPYAIQSNLFLNKALKCKIKQYNDDLYYQGSYERDFLEICDKLNLLQLVKRGS